MSVVETVKPSQGVPVKHHGVVKPSTANADAAQCAISLVPYYHSKVRGHGYALLFFHFGGWNPAQALLATRSSHGE